MKKITKQAPAAAKAMKNKAAETQLGLPDSAVSMPRLLRKFWVKE